MFCKNCGTALEDVAVVCTNCGTEVEQKEQVKATSAPQNNVVYAEPVVTNIIPEQNQPLSPWAYFGLQLLFAIPVIGFVFLIVFSCNGSNINRRNFARSYWCGLVLVAIVLFFAIVLGVLGRITASNF